MQSMWPAIWRYTAGPACPESVPSARVRAMSCEGKVEVLMEVVVWPLERITPFARNARKIPPEAVSKVASSIREFGWRQPIVVDRDGVIVCGHTRLLAAQKLGLREVPVHVADNLTPAQVRAYRLLDNRSHD